jgi:uncharacterized protein YukE
MDPSLMSASAALVGAAIGGAMSSLGSFFVKRREIRAQWIGQSRMRREELYKEFIEEASTCYGDALQHSKPDLAALVVLYARMSQMRVFSSPYVLSAADRVISEIINRYSKENVELTVETLQSFVKSKQIDLLNNFSQACRDEFDSLRAQQLEQ